MSNMIEATELGSFRSYGLKPISTRKTGNTNYYIKDVYKDISNYQKRKIGYLEDRVRKTTVYEKDILKTIKDNDYLEDKTQNRKNSLDYEYSHDENLRKIAVRSQEKRNESEIRESFSHATNSFDRQKVFSNWNTTYTAANSDMLQAKINLGFETDGIKDWFKNKYHDYKRGSYETESMKTIGVYGNNPKEKFTFTSTASMNSELKNKLHNDCHDLNLGTTKTSNHIPGFSGYIQVNNNILKNSSVSDAYSGVNKANHVLTFNTRVPGYLGYVPTNPHNIKGVVRPSCLSTKQEAFY